MALLSRSNSYLLNPSCPVYFQGFETTTASLGRNGWELSVEVIENYYSEMERHEALLFNPKLNTKLFARTIAPFRNRAISYTDCSMQCDNPSFPHFEVHKVSTEHTRFAGTPPRFLEWSSMQPTFAILTDTELESTPLFTNRGTKAKEIIVEPQEVADILESLMRRQAPAQSEIRARSEKKIPVYHANILAFG